jgi:hypothetical protein
MWRGKAPRTLIMERRQQMKSAWLIGGVLAVICAALAVFYLIPGIYHPFTFSGTPNGRHVTHAIVFAALAVVAILGARFAANANRS